MPAAFAEPKLVAKLTSALRATTAIAGADYWDHEQDDAPQLDIAEMLALIEPGDV